MSLPARWSNPEPPDEPDYYARDMAWAERAKAEMPAILADLELVSDLTDKLYFRDRDAACGRAGRCFRALLAGDQCEAGHLLAEIMADELAVMAWDRVIREADPMYPPSLDTAERDAQRTVIREARRLLHLDPPDALTVPAVTPPKAPAFNVED